VAFLERDSIFRQREELTRMPGKLLALPARKDVKDLARSRKPGFKVSRSAGHPFSPFGDPGAK
jgi:hypothetical protein